MMVLGFLLLLTVIFLVILLNRPSSKKEDASYTESRKKETSEKLLAYLENKYQEEFEIIDVGLKNTTSSENYDWVIAKAKNSSEEFRAYVIDENEMSDEYYALLIKDSLAQKLKAAIDTKFNAIVVEAQMYRSFDQRFDQNLSLEDALLLMKQENKSFGINAAIYSSDTGLTEESFQEKVKEIETIFRNEMWSGIYAVYHVTIPIDEGTPKEELQKIPTNKDLYDFREVFNIHFETS